MLETSEKASVHKRVNRLAFVLGFPIPAQMQKSRDGQWYLHSGERVYSVARTKGYHLITEALDAAEAWYAPEFVRLGYDI